MQWTYLSPFADVFLPWEDRLEREYDLELIVTAPSAARKTMFFLAGNFHIFKGP